tara:strand:- start:178756 stop:179301 length:546 start_codon:yes stop_codon:yes gene_type:complete
MTLKHLLFIFLISSFSVIYAQKNKTGPVIEQFGAVFQIENPDLILDKDKVHKVIFDIYTDSEKIEGINPLINSVARFLNMHAQHGVPAANMKVAVVMHGAAAKNALNDSAYQERFKVNNPNIALIAALKEAGVAIYVCGQSFNSRGFKRANLNTNILFSLSAMTALVKYQEEGYQIINFNN